MSIPRPLPRVDPDTERFWAGLADGRVWIQRCVSCRRHQFYPRYLCASCGGEVEWVEASGRGTVYTFSVVRQNLMEPFDGLVPYVLAMIDLEEGVRMVGNVTPVDPDDVYIGMPVEVYTVEDAPGAWLPFWRPVDDGR